MIKKKISKAVISRLPRYYRYLGDIAKAGIERISSEDLSSRMGLTASQIRQDFNNFGGFGHQGYGYNVLYLQEEIGKILGLDRTHSMAIIGMGNIGTALMNSNDFNEKGFFVDAAFDNDPKVIGKVINGIKVQPVDEMIDTLRERNIEIAILAVPREHAKETAEMVVSGGVKGILNFAHFDIKVPKDVVVENVHIADSLMQVSYNITTKEAD